MKVLCLGHATWDTTLPVLEYPIENTKNRINNLVECGGGPASNAAYLLGKWGIDVSFAGVVGNDRNGQKIKNGFINDNVNVDYLELNDKHSTTSSFIIVNTNTGSRTALAYHPSDLKMSIDINETFDYLLIDGQEYEMSLKMIDKCGISVIDAGRCTDEVVDLCKRVDYVVCSKDFALEYTKCSIDNLDKIFEIMNKDFKNVVITLEDKGCVYYDNGVIIIPSLKVKATDSTGAGDIFHGSFVYGLMQGWDIPHILLFANVTGALSVTRVGGRNSVFDNNEVRRIANEISRSNFY